MNRMKMPFNITWEGTPFVKFKMACSENKTLIIKMYQQNRSTFDHFLKMIILGHDNYYIQNW